jgi:demethylmenaquinone methyltransferase/2-methoxy-6-polyprenyl-1,4-benzoquinol methylase
VKHAAVTPADDILDVACGTGDFARAFSAAGPRSVIGCDFAHRMLTRAAAEGAARGGGSHEHRLIRWCEADALRLPFRPGAFSVVACAFGVRNFQDLDDGLAEMHRVLCRGGRLVILEFSRPRGRLLRAIYEFYSGRIMPIAAGWISGDRSGAYRYLPQSVVSFPGAEQMCVRLERAGFHSVTAAPLTFGVVTVYLAYRG